MQYNAIGRNDSIKNFGFAVWASYFTLVSYLAASFSVKRCFRAEDGYGFSLNCLDYRLPGMIQESINVRVCPVGFVADKHCLMTFINKFFDSC